MSIIGVDTARGRTIGPRRRGWLLSGTMLAGLTTVAALTLAVPAAFADGGAGGSGGTGGIDNAASGGVGGAGGGSVGTSGGGGGAGAIGGSGGESLVPGGPGGPTPGADGTDGSSILGGDGSGGGGGAHGYVGTGAPTGVAITGGNGGNGGSADIVIGTSGGGGGAGGYGAVVTGGGDLGAIGTSITGGTGGAGGAYNGPAIGGNGGSGGVGLALTSTDGTTLTIDGAILGGTGGVGGGGVGGTSGTGGAGGAGIVGQNLTITIGETGSVGGGMGGDGVTQADGITFTGGTNTLILDSFTPALFGSIGVTGTLDLRGATPGSSVIINNIITGSGHVNVTGGSTIIMVNANTYTGGTTIAANSTLQLGTDSGGSIVGNVTNNGTLAFGWGSGGGGIFSGDIDGTGAVQVLGFTAATLDGTNTYTGGTVVMTGASLNIGFGGTTGSIVGNVTNNGILAFYRSDAYTFDGVISGDGIVLQNGMGTTTFTGVNTYTGQTMVGNGTLAIGAGGSIAQSSGVFLITPGTVFDISGGGNQTIQDLEGFFGTTVALGGNTLTAGSANSTTFMGTITGSGGLTKVGSGTLTLYDFSTYTGATTVAGGLLEVNGGIQSSFVTVNGGKLGGIGTVGGVLVNSGGTVSPGATTPLLLLLSFLPAPVTTVGTLNVSGNVTFLKGSVFEVEIEPGGSSDLLRVGGSVTLSGGNVAVSQASGFYATGTRYTIIDAEGDVAGKFDGFARTMPFMNLELVYDPHHVYLDVTRNSVAFCDVAITANQCSSSRGADSLGEGNPLFNIILGLPDVASARAAFDALSGELHASARSALIEDSHFLRDSIFDRIRHASLGAGASPQFAALAQVSDFDAQQRTQEGTGLTAWTQAYGAFGHISGNGNAARLDRSSGGFFIGADTTLGETWTIGLATGYSRTSLEVDGRSSRATVDSYHLALYGGARFGNVGLRLGASQTWHHIESSRSITFPGLADSARADYDARSTQLFGEAGYAMDFGPVAIEPFAGLAWVYLDSDRIRENGGVAALNGRGESDSNLFTTLGMRAASEVWKGEGKSLTVRGTLGWRHAFGDVAQSTAFSFAGGSGFNVSGIPIARNALLVEAGFDVKVGRSFTIGAGYSGQFASGNRDHNFRGTLSYRF